ncbi:MAG TPA: HAMP domain-containing sensor histidine kinase [Ilumatobacter sp.]|nr:HAMP domain-containing sensor histidine kinase [Ilumatobacter sp.]
MTADARRPFRRGASVRTGVTLVAALAVAVVLAGASVLVVVLQVGAALEHLDEILSDEAEAIAHSVQSGRGPQVLYDDDRVLVVYDADGEVIATAGRFEGLVGQRVQAADDQGVDVKFAGEVHRVVVEPFTTADGRSGTVVLAEPRDELDDSVSALIRSLLVIVPGAVAVIAGIVWLVVGRALRPIEAIRSEVASIGVPQLDRRVPVPPGDDEVARLADTMNDMLARLEHSVRQQQRFVADASHEMRTPLTRMRTQLEVAVGHPDTVDPAATRRAQLSELRGLQAMLDDLLTLVQLDTGADLGLFELVDLDDLVMDELSTDRLLVSVDASGVSAAQVLGSRSALRRVVRNLLDNARQHARSQVVVSLEEAGGDAVLTVDDDGLGIPPERRAEVLERFVRLDAAPRTEHHGLGLAIVSEIVARHGGSIRIFDSVGGGARVRVRLPLPGPAPGRRRDNARGSRPGHRRLVEPATRR